MIKVLNHRYGLIFFLSLAVSLPYLSRGLYESSEGRYALIAKNMVVNHNFWIPMLDGAPHLTKPPLTYWLIAFGEMVFGTTTTGTRVIHCLCWILLSLMVVRMGELLWDKKTGCIAGLIFTTALFPVIGQWFLTTDPILVFFQGSAFWALLEFWKNERTRWCYLFWLSIGLAFLTKGPVSLFPVMFWIPFFKVTMKHLLKPIPMLLCLFVSCFWYIGLELSNPGILLNLFHTEIIKRSATDHSGRNPFWWAPFATYVLPLMAGWGLWPFFMNWKEVKRFLHENEGRFYLCWIAVTLVIFSLIQSRLILYILPLCLPVTLLIARTVQTNKLRKAFVSNLLLLLLCKTMISFFPYDFNAKEIAKFIRTNTSEKVYYLGKDLYGVQFYLGEQIARFDPEKGIGDKRWFLIQEKHHDYLNGLINEQHKDIQRRIKAGKWNLIQLDDQSDLISNQEK